MNCSIHVVVLFVISLLFLVFYCCSQQYSRLFPSPNFFLNITILECFVVNICPLSENTNKTSVSLGHIAHSLYFSPISRLGIYNVVICL